MWKYISEDLWAALEKASEKPVATVMSTWTKQMGYPVLSVEAKQVYVRAKVTKKKKFFSIQQN